MAKAQAGEGPGLEEREPTVGTSITGETAQNAKTISELGSKVVRLDPSATVRRAGTNQLGRAVFHTKLDSNKHAPMFVVVRDVNRWEDEAARQRYGLAVALWRDPEHAEVYSELSTELEAVAEAEVEIEVEAILGG